MLATSLVLICSLMDYNGNALGWRFAHQGPHLFRETGVLRNGALLTHAPQSMPVWTGTSVAGRYYLQYERNDRWGIVMDGDEGPAILMRQGLVIGEGACYQQRVNRYAK